MATDDALPRTQNQAEAALTDPEPFTAGYRPNLPLFSLWDQPRGGPVATMLYDVERMLAHPHVLLPYAYWKAGIASVEFAVKVKSKTKESEIGAFVHATCQRFWERSLDSCQNVYDYGWLGSEVLYRLEHGFLHYHGLQELYPLDTWALTQKNRYHGVAVSGGLGLWNARDVDSTIGRKGRTFLWGPGRWPAKGFWLTHARRFNRFYGRSQLFGAWRPWNRLATRDGAEEVLDMGCYRFAYRGPVFYYPPEFYKKKDGSDDIDYDAAREKTREFNEQAKAGVALALPNLYDDNGNRKWELDWPEHTMDVSPIITYVQDLQKEISIGVCVPPELLEASEVGSGWSGRIVPLLGFYTTMVKNARAMIWAFQQQVLEPLVRWNWGPGHEITVEVKLKLPESLQSQQPGGPTAPGQPGAGQPGQPGAEAPQPGGPNPLGAQPTTPAPGGDKEPRQLASAVESTGLELATEEWAQYIGPHGGHGWRHTTTGEVVYQVEKPGADAGAGGAGEAVHQSSKPVEHVIATVKHLAPASHNLVSLVKVRAALAAHGMTDRAAQDAAIVAALRSRQVAGSAYEGRHANTPEGKADLAASIPEPGNDRGVKIGYLSLREDAELATDFEDAHHRDQHGRFAANPHKIGTPLYYAHALASLYHSRIARGDKHDAHAAATRLLKPLPIADQQRLVTGAGGRHDGDLTHELAGRITGRGPLRRLYGVALASDDEEGHELAWVRSTSKTGRPRWKDDATGQVRYQETEPGLRKKATPQPAPAPRAPAAPQQTVSPENAGRLKELQAAAQQEASNPQHPMNRLRGQLRDVKFGNGPTIKTVVSEPGKPLTAADHTAMARMHARVGGMLKLTGNQALADAHLQAARKHNDRAASGQPQPTQPAVPKEPQQNRPVPPSPSTPAPAPAPLSPHKMATLSTMQKGLAAVKDEGTRKVYQKAAGNVLARIPDGAHQHMAQHLKGVRFATNSQEMMSHFGQSISAGVDQRLAAKGYSSAVASEIKKQLQADIDEIVAGKKNAAGMYSSATGELFLDGNPQFQNDNRDLFGLQGHELNEQVYAHEMTHAIDGDGRFSGSEDWQKIMGAEFGNEHAPMLTAYAASHPAEGFAEFGRLLYGGAENTQLVEKIFPRASEFFKRNNLWPA